MSITKLALALHHLTPGLNARDPLPRAVAVEACRQLSRELGLTDEHLESARKQIEREEAARLPSTSPSPGSGSKPRPAPSADAVAASKRKLMDQLGPKLWADWHTRALTHRGDDTAYLTTLGRNLPCGECAQHYAERLATHPPRFSDPAFDYFTWTVDFHNAVNARLGKPPMTVEAARALHQSEIENRQSTIP